MPLGEVNINLLNIIRVPNRRDGTKTVSKDATKRLRLRSKYCLPINNRSLQLNTTSSLGCISTSPENPFRCFELNQIDGVDRWYCTKCNNILPMTSSKSTAKRFQEQHVLGRKHSTKAKKVTKKADIGLTNLQRDANSYHFLDDVKDDRNRSVRKCTICNVLIGSHDILLDQHIQGKRHQEIFNKLGISLPTSNTSHGVVPAPSSENASPKSEEDSLIYSTTELNTSISSLETLDCASNESPLFGSVVDVNFLELEEGNAVADPKEDNAHDLSATISYDIVDRAVAAEYDDSCHAIERCERAVSCIAALAFCCVISDSTLL